MSGSDAQPLTDGARPVAAGERAETVTWSRLIVFAGIVLGAALGTLILLRLYAEPLVLLFMAVVIAEAIAPVVTRLERRMPRIAAIVVIYSLLLALVAGFIVFVIPPLAAESQKAANDMPHLLARLAALINRVAPGEGNRIITAVQPSIVQIAERLIGAPISVLSGLGNAVQVMFLSLYWLISAPTLKRFGLSLVPPSKHEQLNSLLHELSSTMGGYLRGVVIDGIIVGTLLYFGLLLLGVKNALLLAVIGAVGELIPIIGPTVAEALATAMALLISPERALLVLAFYLVLEQVDGNVILPLVIRQQTNISPLLITFAVFTGAWADGVIGALVAIPLAGALQVLFVRGVAPMIREWTGAAN